ncbi:hypothetical protein VIM7927_00893 [Vibrio mangrovi]|uniref:Uncharacterized protein n=1 Tax=Vibrio mangrovi TaxID=474394 RepID=A0A1Y6IPT6_9VIBR|nr:hypothetical protein VIM7927_00893 [Vibrio mangrovi]
MLCAPVTLAEMQESPENLFCLDGAASGSGPVFMSRPDSEKPRNPSVDFFLRVVVDLDEVKHFVS